MIRSTLRLSLICAAAAVALAGCAAEEPPPPLPPVVVPPAAPPPPPVALSRPVVEAAAVYRAYIRKASEISPAFVDGAAVERQLFDAAAYEPKQLMKGMIAYGALVALQSPNFVAEVRTYAVDPAGRRDMAARLTRDPNYAQSLPSAVTAGGVVAATLAADAAKVRRTGELVKQAAYDVQKQKWSLAAAPPAAGRLSQAKAQSAQLGLADPETATRYLAAVQGGDAAAPAQLGLATEPLPGPYTAVISRALSLAALAALGEANDETAFSSLLEEQSSAFCLNLSKLNLYQCLSVAGPYYEDVFCLGQHVLMDTGQCLAKAAVITAPDPVRAFMPPPPKPVVAAKPPVRRAPVRRPAAKPAAKPAAAAPAKKTAAPLGPPVGAAASVKLRP